MQNTKARSDVFPRISRNRINFLPPPNRYKVKIQRGFRGGEAARLSQHWIKQREPLIYIKVKWKTMSRTILHKRRHVFPVSRTVPFTASQQLLLLPLPTPPALSSFAVAKALLCRRYPTNRGIAVEITGFHPREERQKEPMKSRDDFSFFYRGWNIFGFACHACGNSMEFEWRSWEEKTCHSEGATCAFEYCGMCVGWAGY